jgi:PE family protein
MADQLPGFQDLTTVGAVSGIAGIALIAEEAAALVAREVADMGGGKYQFHPDELQAVLKQWQGLQHTINAAKSTVHVRVPHSPTVMMPGNESASTTVSDAAHTTNVAYQDYLASMETYVNGYVEKLTTALNNYLQTEQNNSGMAVGAQNHLQA